MQVIYDGAENSVDGGRGRNNKARGRDAHNWLMYILFFFFVLRKRVKIVAARGETTIRKNNEVTRRQE